MECQRAPGDAAAIIQKLYRGYSTRRKYERYLHAITRLQAMRRGHLIRHEFRPLINFQREQAVFLKQSKQRQKSIIRKQTELEFLRGISAQNLTDIETARKITCARKIQNQWHRYRFRTKRKAVNPVPREFDPFGFRLLTHEAQSLLDAKVLAEDDDVLDSLYIREQDRFLSRETMLSEAIDAVRKSRAPTEEYTELRKQAEKRIKGLTETRFPSVAKKYSRRELHDEIKSLTQNIAEKLADYKKQYRTSQEERAVHAELIQRSCTSRLNVLTSLSKSDHKPTQEDIESLFDDVSMFEDMKDWSLERKYAAYKAHMNTVRCISIERDDRKWFETFIAGKQYNLYHYLRPEKDVKSHVWRQNDIQEDQDEADMKFVIQNKSFNDAYDSASDDEPAAISRFSNPEVDQAEEDVRDIHSSQLWKAFCTNQILHPSVLASEGPHSDKSNFTIASETVAHPNIFEWYTKCIALKREEDIQSHIAYERNSLRRKTCNLINEIESAVRNNTKEIERIAFRQEERKQAKGREQIAVNIIQRVARGYAARKKAKEIEHKYFTRIRGRLIRKGKCEECGNAAAVLRCEQCEQSSHFCPVCWVHSHETPQRKNHIAIPMGKEIE